MFWSVFFLSLFLDVFFFLFFEFESTETVLLFRFCVLSDSCFRIWSGFLCNLHRAHKTLVCFDSCFVVHYLFKACVFMHSI